MTVSITLNGPNGPPGPIAASAATTAALAATESSTFLTGSLAYVATLRAYFVLDKTSTLTVDTVGLTVLYATFNGTLSTSLTAGRWLRITNVTHPYWRSVTGWYVNGGTGSNENDGSLSSPVKDFDEIYRRLGAKPDISGVVTVTVQDTTYAGRVRIEANLQQLSELIVSGTETVAATGTVTSATGVNDAWTLTCSGFDFSQHIGRKIRLTSGTYTGAYGYVIEAPSLGSAVTTNFAITGDGSTANVSPQDVGSVVPWTFEILTCTRFTGPIEVDVAGGPPRNAGGYYYPHATLKNAQADKLAMASPLLWTDGVRITSLDATGYYPVLKNSLVSQYALFSDYCAFECGGFLNAIVVVTGQLFADGQPVAHNTKFFVALGGYLQIHDYLCVRKSSQPIQIAARGRVVVQIGITGTGNTTATALLSDGGKLTYSPGATFNVTGTGAGFVDVRVQQGDGTIRSELARRSPITGDSLGKVSISSSTNASPIAVTTATAHGLTTGDRVAIENHLVNTAANGTWSVTVTGSTTFTLDTSTGNGVGAATGTVTPTKTLSFTNLLAAQSSGGFGGAALDALSGCAFAPALSGPQ